jgi:hypothetical protein
MGIFSGSPRNVKRTKVIVAPYYPSLASLLDKPTPAPLSKDQLMYHALLKMAGRRKFRAAVHAVQFSNMIGDHIESRRRNMMRKKLRASVRCINFVQLLAERQAARRSFRASVHAVGLVNSLATSIEARRKFRAAVKVITLSDRLVDRPLHNPFDLGVFQDSVNLISAVKQLERPFTSATLQQGHEDLVRKTGMRHLFNEAVENVLQGEGGRDEVIYVKQEWAAPTVVHGKLVHQSRDFTTHWKFVEQEQAPPNAE